MGILSRLVSVSDEFASQARQRVLDQRRALKLLEPPISSKINKLFGKCR